MKKGACVATNNASAPLQPRNAQTKRGKNDANRTHNPTGKPSLPPIPPMPPGATRAKPKTSARSINGSTAPKVAPGWRPRNAPRKPAAIRMAGPSRIRAGTGKGRPGGARHDPAIP